MRRATIKIGDEIEAQLASWMRQQDAAPSPTTVVQAENAVRVLTLNLLTVAILSAMAFLVSSFRTMIASQG